MAGISERSYGSLSNRKNKGDADVHDDGVGDSSNNFDHETYVLLMYAVEAKQAAKLLAKHKKDVHRKMKKTKSKYLEDYKGKYNVNLKDLQEAANKIVKVLLNTEPHPEKGIKRRKSDIASSKFRTKECNECSRKQTEIWRLTDDLNRKTDEVNRLQNEQEEKTAVVNRLQWKLNELQNEKTDEVNRLQKELNELKNATTDEVNRLERQLKESKKVFNDMLSTHVHVSELQNWKQKYNEEKLVKEDSLRRLSAMASSKLRDNNPNITDLSDVNRPTKIGEKMSELYDNEWTDAYDELEKHFSERDVIQKLLDLIKAVYDGCKSISTDHFFETIQVYIEQSDTSAHAIARKDAKLPDTLKQQIKEFRKFKAIETLPHIQKLLCNRTTLLTEPTFQTKHAQIYIKKCIELCWLMAVQDPPLFLSTDVPASFDTNRFKDYTKRGPYIEFLVWPTLYLHEGGAILIKGVAQGCKSVPPARQSSFERGHPN